MTLRVALAPERVHERYAPRIGRHVRAVMGADPEHDDLVQEILLTVISKIDTVRDPACLDWWVVQVTANTLKQVVRRRRLRRHTSVEDLREPQIPTLQVDFQARELAGRALEVMHSLPACDRALLTSYWFSPATAKTLATEIGCSVVTVRRKLGRARARFEKLARRDSVLSRCIDDARTRSRRWRSMPAPLPASMREPTRARVPDLVA